MTERAGALRHQPSWSVVPESSPFFPDRRGDPNIGGMGLGLSPGWG